MRAQQHRRCTAAARGGLPQKEVDCCSQRWTAAARGGLLQPEVDCCSQRWTAAAEVDCWKGPLGAQGNPKGGPKGTQWGLKAPMGGIRRPNGPSVVLERSFQTLSPKILLGRVYPSLNPSPGDSKRASRSWRESPTGAHWAEKCVLATFRPLGITRSHGS